MSKRRTTQSKPRNNNWAMLIIGLVFAGGLIALSVFSATRQLSEAGALSGDVIIGTPLGVAAPTRTLGDVSMLPRGKVSHVDVVYFHRTQRCTACLNAGRFTRETVETYFANYLQRGVMSFRQLNVEKPENAVIARKYAAAWSSLYLGIVIDGVEYLCPIDDIWFYTNSKTSFTAFLQKTLAPLIGEL
ncbi:hypothetical protein ANRL3_00065 [Anaerolineae bacterium]|nr:hypothetical protein ANRL3_00065 [Anaerolineae bacterium]